MKILQKIKDLNIISEKLGSLKSRYINAAHDNRCDKHDMTFDGDDRFSVFSVTARLCCYTGYFGSSSCSTLATVDSSVVQKHFTKYLNVHMDDILTSLSNSISSEAAQMTDKARAELQENINMLDDIDNRIKS